MNKCRYYRKIANKYFLYNLIVYPNNKKKTVKSLNTKSFE